MIISIDVGKGLDKIQHPVMIKTLNKLRREGNYLNIKKATQERSTMNIKLKGEILTAFPPR